ncbi:hypothetical protein HNQ80_002384 [Anaerosolibacter carboniphilus]|uniref:Uncharacterized protein n=1 Tax=Anaerosolibacter carboniphilus TaxID=1417629 RepID=A0A841L1P8_9FIRM|nr:hypothetical protein [Anaerosolibacter carboniphilus]MBB6216285.1 hypothetical protein [Anaerosolibacter carboniphilus]
MESSGERLRRIGLSISLGVIVFLLIILSLTIYKNNLVSNLEQETLQELTECILKYQGDFEACKKSMLAVTSEFEAKKEAIDQGIWLNSLTGLLLAIGVSLASLSKVVKNIKSIVVEMVSLFKNGKDKSKRKNQMKNKKDDEPCQPQIIIPSNLKGRNYMEIDEIIELINQFNNMEKDKVSSERQLQIEKIMELLMDRVVKLLSQADHFTSEIDHDREQLTIGITEIKKGIEHISQTILENEKNGNGDYGQEIMTSIEEMHMGIEEIGILLLQMEKKLKKIKEKKEQEKA